MADVGRQIKLYDHKHTINPTFEKRDALPVEPTNRHGDWFSQNGKGKKWNVVLLGLSFPFREYILGKL